MPPSDVITKGSALHCDCNVRWLKEWLLDKSLGDITCASPAKVKGVSVTKLKEKHLVCGMFYKISSLSLTRKSETTGFFGYVLLFVCAFLSFL